MTGEQFEDGILCRSTMESSSVVTDYFFAKLSAASKQQFSDLVQNTPALKRHFDHPVQLQNRLPGAQRRRDILYFGNHYLAESFNRETGLFDFNPPDSVHAMVRNQIYCGDLYYADLIAEALAQAGRTFRDGAFYLDFGCSSGRVVMPLAIAYKNAHFYACDPIPSAVGWAEKSIAAVAFAHTAEYPPLPYPNRQFDMVYAISIWSHFTEFAARAWLDEMQRIIKPGGYLLFTTHGFGALKYFRDAKAMAAEDIDYCWRALLRQGFCFFDIYANNRDWGLKSADWGQMFINPIYILTHLMARWNLIWFASRRAEDNQDVYLFENRGPP